MDINFSNVFLFTFSFMFLPSIQTIQTFFDFWSFQLTLRALSALCRDLIHLIIGKRYVPEKEYIHMISSYITADWSNIE